MAPFRSSRSTRNNDPATLNRGRGGVIDHDPTEGLPVRNWYLGNISIKQDEPVANDDEQQVNANTVNPDYPWPELRLPGFYSELPPLSQQIVRVARSGRPMKPSVYDKKTGTYISHAEYAARNTLKSKHLENVDSPAAEDDDDMDEEPDAKTEMEKQERAFAMRKWAQVPPAVADRRPEPKYLADRRPGMRSLYGFQAAAMNPALNVAATGTTTMGFDLGDGSGLGNATGVLAASADKPPTAVTPVKRMPPKRKKKGGPGRKKANHGTGISSSAGVGDLSTGSVNDASNLKQAADGNMVSAEGDTNMEDAHDDEDQHDDEGSGSEEEGSEDGEIDDSQIHDTEMKTDEAAAVAAPEDAAQTEVPSVVAAIEEVSVPAESVVIETVPEAIAETLPPAIEVVKPIEPIDAIEPIEPIEQIEPVELVEPVDPAPLPAAAVTSEEVALVPESAPEEIMPEPVEPITATAKIDFLSNLDDAVADMEKKDE